MIKEDIKPLKLGEKSYISIGTPNIESSDFFYKKLGFHTISEGNSDKPWKIISDNSINLKLIKDERRYLKFTYLTENLSEKVEELQNKGISFSDRFFNEERELTGIGFFTPENIEISVIKKDDSEVLSDSINKLIDIKEDEITNIYNYPELKCGLFGEVSLPVHNLIKAIEFWAEIGFVPLNIYSEPYHWAVLTDGINVIGLHQSPELNFSAITYFAPDMTTRIKRLKDSGITPFKIFGNQDDNPKNVMYLSPEGQKFFYSPYKII